MAWVVLLNKVFSPKETGSPVTRVELLFVNQEQGAKFIDTPYPETTAPSNAWLDSYTTGRLAALNQGDSGGGLAELQARAGQDVTPPAVQPPTDADLARTAYFVAREKYRSAVNNEVQLGITTIDAPEVKALFDAIKYLPEYAGLK